MSICAQVHVHLSKEFFRVLSIELVIIISVGSQWKPNEYVYQMEVDRRWSLWSHCSKVSLTVYHICEIKCLWNIWDAVNVILVMSLSSCGRLKSMSMWGSFSRFRVKIQKQSHRVALLLLVTAFCKPSNLLFFFFLSYSGIWFD